MGVIFNAADTPLDRTPAGGVPNMGGALRNWFQPITFERVVKTTVGYQAVEAGTPIEFRGVIQPFSSRDLLLKPEGQRAWSWYRVHAEPGLALADDEVVIWQGLQMRVMGQWEYNLYGYIEYHLIEDYKGSGPTVGIGSPIDGGTPFASGPDVLDGGTPPSSGPDDIEGGGP